MADMADILKNFASMMDGKDVPDNVKEMFASMAANGKDKDAPNSGEASSTINSSNDTSSNSSNATSNRSSNSTSNNVSDNTSEIPNIDIDTILKMQKIMSSLNSTKNSSGANLLRALKPYLRPNRQAKVDEYINLLGIEKIIDLMNNQNSNKKSTK